MVQPRCPKCDDRVSYCPHCGRVEIQKLKHTQENYVPKSRLPPMIQYYFRAENGDDYGPISANDIRNWQRQGRMDLTKEMD